MGDFTGPKSKLFHFQRGRKKQTVSRPKVYFYFPKVCTENLAVEIDRSPKDIKDLVLRGKWRCLDGKEGTRSKGNTRVTVTGFVHDWPGFFGVTQVYIGSRLVHRRAIARVPLESTSRVVGGEIEAVLLISSMGRSSRKRVVVFVVALPPSRYDP